MDKVNGISIKTDYIILQEILVVIIPPLVSHLSQILILESGQ
jgi:hypothetical protein